MKGMFTLFFALVISLSMKSFGQPIPTQVVISQVYGGGGNTSATYTNDFIELFNPTNAAINLAGYSLQYASATGSSWSNKVDLVGTIQPGKYFLVGLSSGGAVGIALPTPDQTGVINMSGTAGKVALLNITTQIGAITCPVTDAAFATTLVDFVGYGTTANCFEGTGSAPAPSNTTSVSRLFSGCIDYNSNNVDFTSGTPNPRNSATNAISCGTLPINITSFNASLVDGKTTLTWSSVNENNVKGFSVEKSLNGVNYSEIAFLNAANRSSNNYTASDATVKPGNNYYRLKVLDLDGSVRFSNVVVIVSRNSIKTEIFPNPAVSNITVAHERAEKGAVIRILSMEGKQVKMIQVQPGAQQTGLMVNELVKGNYLLIFESNGEKVTSKFTKQ